MKSGSTLEGRACFEAINGPPPGKFIETTHGTTHYVLEGPNEGKLVVLQHGVGSNLGVFDKIAADLVSRECRVLRYDFYDRGYSETDPQRYPVKGAGSPHPLDFTLDVYVEQFRDVLTKLGLENEDFIHCGHSNGGVLGIGYTAKCPDHVKGLVLIDAVCLPASKPLAAKVAELPYVGPIVVGLFGADTFLKFARASCTDPALLEDFFAKLERNVKENARFFAAVQSTNSNCKGFVGSAEPEFRQCCKAKIPIHGIWGKADTSVPYSQWLALKQIATWEGLKDVGLVTDVAFEGMPHNVFFEDSKPEECSQSICEFVSKH